MVKRIGDTLHEAEASYSKRKQPNEPKHMGLFESFHRLRYIDLHERSQMQAIPQDPIITFSR